MSSRIHNYKLEEAYESDPLLQDVNEMTIPASFSTLDLGLWDEAEQRLISFREAHERYADAYASAAEHGD